jgi:probable HAF family extracellular repeat protein
MRLPVVHQISTKDGTSNKNARLTNVLKETRKTGDLAIVRPGLEEILTTTGNGYGLVCFNNNLVSVYGSTLGIGYTPAEVSYEDLGSLGGALGAATCCSSNGSVIAGLSNVGSSPIAFSYTTGGGISSLGLLAGTSYSMAYDIASDGSVIVGRSWSEISFKAFKWTSGGGMVEISSSCLVDALQQVLVFCSSDGSVIAGTKTNYKPFRWTSGGGAVELSLPAGWNSCQTTGISSDGSTLIGFGEDETFDLRAWRWTSGTGIVALGTEYGIPYAVSSDGSVIVGAMTVFSGEYTEEMDPINVQHAFLWNSVDGMTDIGTLGTTPDESIAYDVSSDGVIVVGTSTAGTSSIRGFTWNSGSGMVDIGDAPSPFIHIYAKYVSSDGSVVGGYFTRDGTDTIYRPFFCTSTGEISDAGGNDPYYYREQSTALSSDGTTIVGIAIGFADVYPFSSLVIPAQITYSEPITGNYFDFAQTVI